MSSAVSAPRERRINLPRTVQTVLLVAFFLAIGAALTTPVSDPDFWWHIASGRWMWERGELMRADPFAFTSSSFPPSTVSEFPFTQYWLADLLLHGVHARFGLEGVILLRAAVFTLMFVLLYRLLRSLGAGVLAAVLLVSLAVRAVVYELSYVGDRPQMWTSLLFVAALLLVQRQREGRQWAFVCLPLLMLLWSNLHGGYLIGLAVAGSSAATAEITGQASRRSRLSAVASLLLSGCNPAGFSVLLNYPAARVLVASSFTGVTEESSLQDWVTFSSSLRLVPGLIAVLVLSLAVLLPRARITARQRPDLLALYVISLAMGFVAMRFLIFVVVVALALITVCSVGLRQTLHARITGRFPGARATAVRGAATCVALVVLTAQHAAVAARTSALRPSADYHHPYEGAADFLERSGVEGNLFNDYGAGGYLAWRLFPSLKVFIYGRALSRDLLDLYGDLLLNPSASVGARQRYQAEFDAHRVDTVVLPSCNPTTGLILPLTVLVARDEEWGLIYSDATAVILVRRSTAPDHLLAGTLPPTALYDNMLAIADAAGRTGHGRAMPAWRYSRAFALYGRGERAAALAALDEYLLLAPGHAAAVRMRERIRGEIESSGGATPPALREEGIAPEWPGE